MSFLARNRGRWSLVVAFAIALGCGRGGGSAAGDAQAGADAGTTSGVAVVAAGDNKPSTVIDFVARADECSFGLRGPLIDLGEPGTRVRGASNEELVLERVEREGASFARVRERSIVVPFFVTPDDERAFGELPTVISARICCATT